MSTSVTISRDVDVTVHAVDCDNRNHGALTFNVDTNRDGSLVITVEPCENCLSDAKEEGKEEGIKASDFSASKKAKP